MELSRKSQEIEHLKTLNHEHEENLSKSEIKINDLLVYIESIGGNPHSEHMAKENSDTLASSRNLANDLNDIIQNIESKMSDIDKMSKMEKMQEKEKFEFNDDLEILKRENQLLITKCKEIQAENEVLKRDMMKISAGESKLIKEVEKLKEEVQRQKQLSRDIANKDLLNENRKLNEELSRLREVN